MTQLRLPAPYLLACLLGLIGRPALAQVMTNSSGTSTEIAIYDPYAMAYNNVDGSPYIPEKGFAEGLFGADGATQRMPIRYNMQEGQVEYLKEAKVLRMITPINEFRMVTGAGDTLLFRNGFSGRGELAKKMYCQVLFDGKKSTLIRSMTATIKANEDPMSNDFGKRRLVQKDIYYLVIGGEPAAVSPTKNSLLAAVPAAQKDAFTTAVNSQPGKIKTWNDVRQVLMAYEAN